jgi:hypothetical protein
MTDPSTAREALIVEAIGDVARLLDRVEALVISTDDSRQAAVDANMALAGQLAAFEHRMASLTENAKMRAMEHIAHRVDGVARQATAAQTQAMTQAARDLFKAEIEQPVQRLTKALLHVIERADRPWEIWLTHAATAVASSAATWAFAAHL